MNINNFLSFLDNSPTPYHCVESIKKILKQNNFIEYFEDEKAIFDSEKKYFCIRHDSSIVAWIMPKKKIPHSVLILAAHTDSPGLKIRPKSDIKTSSSGGYFQQSTEIYGGVLLNTWFDRDLTIAGRILYSTQNSYNKLEKSLIHIGHPIAHISSLAIHLNRDANENKSINKHKELNAILSTHLDSTIGLNEIIKDHLKLEKSDIHGYDLFLVDTQKSALTGLHKEFISAARLDNQLSCYAIIQSLIQAVPSDQLVMAICTDHEEIGSESLAGAMGSFLEDILYSIIDEKEFKLIKGKSLLVSVDNAHALHPNYPEKHDGLSNPIINEGPVLKVNANMRYTTDAHSMAIISDISLNSINKIPIQKFASRSDLSCGSTIGPMTSAKLGIPSVDLGVPTFAMHSIRELAGIKDLEHLINLVNNLITYEK